MKTFYPLLLTLLAVSAGRAQEPAALTVAPAPPSEQAEARDDRGVRREEVTDRERLKERWLRSWDERASGAAPREESAAHEDHRRDRADRGEQGDRRSDQGERRDIRDDRRRPARDVQEERRARREDNRRSVREDRQARRRRQRESRRTR